MSQASRKSPNILDRRYFIGGSDTRIIMGSDEAALLRLWQEKRGELEPEDLSSNLIVQLGIATEELNRTGTNAIPAAASRTSSATIKHSAIPWMAATLDGVDRGDRSRF